MHPLSKFKYCPACGSGQFLVHNIKSKKCGACGFVYYFNPSAAVACFVRDGQDNLLVAVRGKEPARGTYDLPGGFVDENETGEEAILRELKEETGLLPQAVRYLFSIPNIYPYSGFTVRTLDMFFECTVEELRCAAAADDVAELKILAPAQIDPGRFGLESVRKAVCKYYKL
ncbi:MAG: NUDIX domain-containing protein [Rikenellaceae bacterium]|nr:NUDIX domain-containing protein [Rikenellaceae bacterium]